jgi:hypothetical protein
MRIKVLCLAARARVEEKLSERLGQDRLQLWHNFLNVRRGYVSPERGFVCSPLERQETSGFSDNFH